MLALLLKVPESRQDWDVYSFNVRSEVDRINEAILSQLNVSLPSYELDPIDFGHEEDWRINLSQAVGAICSVLHLQSQDIFNVNLQDPSAKAGWVFSVYQELLSAETTLQI